MDAIRVVGHDLRQKTVVDDPQYVTLRQAHNARGSVEFASTVDSPAFQWLAEDGARVVLTGASEMPWSGELSTEIGPATDLDRDITYTAVDDWGIVMDFPVPVNPNQPADASTLEALGQSVRATGVTSTPGTVENQVGYYIWRNTGSAEGTVKAAIADTLRWWGRTDVVIAPNLGRGGPPAMLPPTRFDRLEEVCVPIIEAAGLGLRIAQLVRNGIVDPYITVDVWEPRTYGQTITPGSEVIQSGTYRRDRRPQANAVVGGGPGQDAARAFRVARDEESIAKHGVIPVFQDMTGLPVEWPDGLDQAYQIAKYLMLRSEVTAEAKAAFDRAFKEALAKALTERQITAVLTVALAESDGFFLGTKIIDGERQRGFELGSAIPVEAAGVKFTERIRLLTVTQTRGGGDQIEPSFGGGSSNEVDIIAREVANLGRKIAALTTSR